MGGVGISRGTARQLALVDQNELVIAGLDAAIHDFPASAAAKNVDARDKPGHDKELKLRSGCPLVTGPF
jgi:hypothetical protein